MNKEDLKSFILVANFFVVTVLVFVGWKIYKNYTQTCKVEGFQTCSINFLMDTDANRVLDSTKEQPTLIGGTTTLTDTDTIDTCKNYCCNNNNCKSFIYQIDNNVKKCSLYSTYISASNQTTTVLGDTITESKLGHRPVYSCIRDLTTQNTVIDKKITNFCEE